MAIQGLIIQGFILQELVIIIIYQITIFLTMIYITSEANSGGTIFIFINLKEGIYIYI